MSRIFYEIYLITLAVIPVFLKLRESEILTISHITDILIYLTIISIQKFIKINQRTLKKIIKIKKYIYNGRLSNRAFQLRRKQYCV